MMEAKNETRSFSTLFLFVCVCIYMCVGVSILMLCLLSQSISVSWKDVHFVFLMHDECWSWMIKVTMLAWSIWGSFEHMQAIRNSLTQPQLESFLRNCPRDGPTTCHRPRMRLPQRIWPSTQSWGSEAKKCQNDINQGPTMWTLANFVLMLSLFLPWIFQYFLSLSSYTIPHMPRCQ